MKKLRYRGVLLSKEMEQATTLATGMNLKNTVLHDSHEKLPVHYMIPFIKILEKAK